VLQVNRLRLVVAVAADAVKRLDLNFFLVRLLNNSLSPLVIVFQIVSHLRLGFALQAEFL